MNSLSTQAILGAVSVAIVAVVAATFGGLPVVTGLSAALTAGLAGVAFVAQSRRLRDEGRLVYRPVYVRRHDAPRRVRSGD